MLNLIAAATMTISVVFQPYMFQDPYGELVGSDIDHFETMEECEADGEFWTAQALSQGGRFYYQCLEAVFEIEVPGQDS